MLYRMLSDFYVLEFCLFVQFESSSDSEALATVNPGPGEDEIANISLKLCSFRAMLCCCGEAMNFCYLCDTQGKKKCWD